MTEPRKDHCGNCANMARVCDLRKCVRGAKQPPHMGKVMMGSLAGAVGLGKYAQQGARAAELRKWIKGLKTVTEDRPATAMCGYQRLIGGGR